MWFNQTVGPNSGLVLNCIGHYRKEVESKHRLEPGNLSTKVYLYAAKLINWNFHPIEIVSRRRDPQFQVGKNYSDLTKWRSTILKSC